MCRCERFSRLVAFQIVIMTLSLVSFNEEAVVKEKAKTSKKGADQLYFLSLIFCRI